MWKLLGTKPSHDRRMNMLHREFTFSTLEMYDVGWKLAVAMEHSIHCHLDLARVKCKGWEQCWQPRGGGQGTAQQLIPVRDAHTCRGAELKVVMPDEAIFSYVAFAIKMVMLEKCSVVGGLSLP
jgi:hypothetical protein